MINAGNFKIENPFRPVISVTLSDDRNLRTKQVSALVDTGAMRSFVSVEVAKELGLKKAGTAMMSGATSKKPRVITLCRLNVHFPFGYVFDNILVGKMSGIVGREYDFVIRMDIISCGDMLITNADCEMILSLRFPPDSERQMFPRY